MGEIEWVTAVDPQAMLLFLQGRGLLTERKARLFAVACCRRLWPLLVDDRSRRAVEAAEGFADGDVTRSRLLEAHAEARRAADEAFDAALPPDVPDDLVYWGHEVGSDAGSAAHAAYRACSPDVATVCEVGQDAARALAHHASPLRLAHAIPLDSGDRRAAEAAERLAQAASLRDLFGLLAFRPALLPSGSGSVSLLARATYEERSLPDGTLDRSHLAVLADALEEAGCMDTEALQHCRGPGLHVRGCWLLDVLLAKEPITSLEASAGGAESSRPGPVLGAEVRFRPSRAEGLPDVREVVVRPDRLEVNTAGRWLTFPFRRIGRRQESRVASLVKQLIGRSPWPVMVADRDWFHPPRDRFFLWYTDPPLRTCMPEDEPAGHAASYFSRIQAVLRLGGYASFDLG